MQAASDAQLDGGQGELGERAVTLEGHVDRASDEVADERALEIADTGDRTAVEGDDDVAGPDARRGSGTAVEELDDLEARRATEPLGERRGQTPRAADDPEVGPPDPAVAHQGGEDQAGRGVDRDGEPEADAGDGRVDADDPAPDVGEGATGVAGVQGGVGLDDVLDEPARPPVAGGEGSAQGATPPRR